MIGGDYVDALKNEISSHGLGEVEHWPGRKVGEVRRQIPRHTRLVVILCDYINHKLSAKVRENAYSRGLPVVFCRRSVADVREKLLRLRQSGVLDVSGGQWKR
ncbi:MAG: DUF2325 domain-containing protein [Betaproteobacteria bacterium]|nr:DUF2325 domain-containing protein [Betaproteobacteria bacterium]